MVESIKIKLNFKNVWRNKKFYVAILAILAFTVISLNLVDYYQSTQTVEAKVQFCFVLHKYNTTTNESLGDAYVNDPYQFMNTTPPNDTLIPRASFYFAVTKATADKIQGCCLVYLNNTKNFQLYDCANCGWQEGNCILRGSGNVTGLGVVGSVLHA